MAEYQKRQIVNALPTGTNVLGSVKVTDGTNFMPTMDVAGRRGYVQLTNGSNVVGVSGTGLATLIKDSSLTIYANLNNSVSDGVSTPGASLFATTLNHGFNGTTWDRLRSDTNKYLYTTIGTSLPSGTNYVGKVKLTDGTNDAECTNNALQVVIQDDTTSTKVDVTTVNGDEKGSSNGAIYTMSCLYAYNGTSYDRLRNDPLTYYLVTIDPEHHEVHSGKFFTVYDIDTSVDIVSPKYWHIITPNTGKRAHIKLRIIASGVATVEIFENPTTTGNGTSLVAYNNDRNSATNTTFSFYYDPTVSADGTRIDGGLIGSAGRGSIMGGEVRNAAEWILDQDQQYLIKVTTAGDGTQVDIKMEFYEI